jgi:hypothetical protein
MAPHRIIVVALAATGLALLALSVRTPASAATPDASMQCLLAMGQMQPCVQPVDCVSFNAVCNTTLGYCVCPSSNDASVLVDAGVPDATMFVKKDAGSLGGVPPGTGAPVGKQVGGCSYTGF